MSEQQMEKTNIKSNVVDSEVSPALNDDGNSLTTTAGDDSSSATNVDTTSIAQEFLNTGKRNLACDDYAQAVEALAEACQILAEKFGDQGIEVAEAYFYYGKSLLGLSRMENGVLGNALDGVAYEEENEAELSESDQFEKASKLPEDERENIVTEVYSAMSAEEKDENKACTGEDTVKDTDKNDTSAEKGAEEDKEKSTEESAEKDSAEEEEGKDDEVVEGGDEGADEEEVDSADSNAEEAGSSQEEGDEADDIPNLQLAWEVLELSKRAYIEQTTAEDCDKSIKVKLSEVYRVLGEVSLEAGSYEKAIQDITSCLQTQIECMDADNRFIAETHYQLGNAYLFNRDYTQAVEQLRKAKSVIESRISNLTSCEEVEGKEKREKELKELKDLLPDIIAKVEDVEEESREAAKAESEVKAIITSQQGNTTIGFGDAPAPEGISTIATKKANDISNLVRKRKPEDQNEEEKKKSKSDAGDKENGKMEISAGDS